MFPDLKTEWTSMWGVLEAHFSSPTPIASIVSSLLLLSVLGGRYAVVTLVRGKGLKQEEETRGGRFLGTARRIDRAIIANWSYVTGTRYEAPALRLTVLIIFFTALALASGFAPWPFGLVPVIVGV